MSIKSERARSVIRNRYVAISLDEFKAALQKMAYGQFPCEFYEYDWIRDDDGEWVRSEEKRPINEYCFIIPLVGRDYFIKIYSSIAKDSSLARPKGDDAIRLVAADQILKPIRPHFSRVNRICSWQENFEKRIRNILHDLGNDVACEICGRDMVIKRNGEFVNFLACTNPRWKEEGCRTRSIRVAA